jgi:serine/threonine protein kinase/tetratricopeptide (TPR) repeat protein
MSDGTEIVRLNDRGGSSTLPTSPQGPNGVPLPPGAVFIPGYEILEEVGRGGMGVVYKARQCKLNRLVALKVMLGGAFAGDPEKARFRVEAESLARLHHPNIVQVYDVGEYAGVAYIAFEFVNGPTLRRWQQGGRLEPQQAARLASAIARAVQHAHDQGIVHRDLKPANILLAEDRGQRTEDREERADTGPSLSSVLCPLSSLNPKVSDFGLAKPIDSDAAITMSGVACGTPNYMSPEQVRGGPPASRPAVDVWGLGAVLFEMLTGRPPFVGPDASTIMQDIAILEPPSVRHVAPGVPRDLAVIVAKCLEKNPARRYLSPAEAADDLDRFLAGQPILARPVVSLVRAGRWVRRNPLPTAFGTFLFAALVGVSASALALQRSAERERQALAGEQAARLEEAGLRKKADDALEASEKAGKATLAALARERAAREGERDARLEEEKLRKQADKARKDAEKNLVIAWKSVGHVLSTASSLSERDDPALIPVYRTLLAGLEPFINEIIAQKSGDREVLLDQAAIARELGRMEAIQGRLPASREHLLFAVGRLRELVRDDARTPRDRFELARTLALAGCVSAELRAADAALLLGDARAMLEEHLATRPKDVEALNELIRVRLATHAPPGSPAYTDEHDRAVLDLVDRLVAIQGETPHLRKTRAHAINNIASDLTNRGKTDEAEVYWVEVLALREGLYKVQPDDRITRYELGKCLNNYANQLAATWRGDESFRARERAAALFDALRDDARYRPTYLGVMIDTDFKLAGEYTRRGETDKARARWGNAIALNALLLARDPKAVSHRATHANAHTRRAELADQTGRHTDAARDFKLAAEYSTDQRHRDYCSARHALAVARSGNRAAAAEFALKLDPEKLAHPHPCVELARAWLAIAKSAGADSSLDSEEQGRVVEGALTNARNCILVAQKKGWFRTAQELQSFRSQKEFEPIWDIFPRD